MRLIDADKLIDDYNKSEGTISDLMELILDAAEEALPPNNQLTLKELRKMDGEPVWVIFYAAYGETVGIWALVSVDEYTRDVFLTNRLGDRSAYEEVVLFIEAIYRRKPEEGTI